MLPDSRQFDIQIDIKRAKQCSTFQTDRHSNRSFKPENNSRYENPLPTQMPFKMKECI